MQFYLRRGCYFTQIEAYAILGIRLGYSTVGLGWGIWRKRLPWWMKGPRLTLWSHSGQSDQRWIFRLDVFGRRIGYLTRGDASPEHDAYYTCGWKIR